MTDGGTERAALVAYRLERAREALVEADTLAEMGHWNTCVNRLYYACFYAPSATLLTRGLASPKHTGVRSLFNRELVRPGHVAAHHGALFNTLLESRQDGDYEDLVRFAEQEVRPWLSQARDFVTALQMLAEAGAENR